MRFSNMNKVLFFVLFFSIGLICFSQELRITSVVYDGTAGRSDGNWPSGIAPAKMRWDNLFTTYNLVQLVDDPFRSNELIQRIGNRAIEAVNAQGDGMTRFFGQQAYTVYFVMGDRRFICFLYNALGETHRFWYWVFEVK